MTSVAPATPSAPTSFSRSRNRRRYTRISTRQTRACFLAQGIAPADGWVVDISLGGVFLRTSWPLPIGEKLAIELPRTGTAAPVCVRGRVVSSSSALHNTSRAGMGVRFDALDPMTLSELRELIREHAPAGTRLEHTSSEDNEVTAVAPIPSASAPGPRFSAPPPAPRMSAPTPKLTAATPSPIQPAQPSAPRMGARHVVGAELEIERLRNHAKGLLMQVGDLQTQMNTKDREIETLREAIVRLQASNAQLLRNR
jgi:hypothetical protein